MKSLYADIALTVADHLYKTAGTDAKEIGMNVSDMNVKKPLIVTGNGPQLFRASASADWNVQRVLIDFYSVIADGKKTIDHATCAVKSEDSSIWQKDWRRDAYLIKGGLNHWSRVWIKGKITNSNAALLTSSLALSLNMVNAIKECKK